MNVAGDYQLLNALLILAAVYFALGVVALAVGRNAATPLAAFGMMFQSAMLVIAASGRFHADIGAQRDGVVWLLTTVFVAGSLAMAWTAVRKQTNAAKDEE